jgi:L-lactate dehydrogenase complex protein LldE
VPAATPSASPSSVVPRLQASRVALFVTCLGDTFFPEVGKATVTVLERLGLEVAFPREQTCCGQLHFNAGYADEARTLARRFVRVFEGHETVVSPSASCAAHVREHVPELAGRAKRVSGSEPLTPEVFELSEFLVGRLGMEDLGARYDGPVTYHPSCHSLRLLKVGDAPLRLLRGVAGLELRELPEAEECCGFGGTFAVKNAAVSTAMLRDKLGSIAATGAGAVCACDSSCLMHIGGGLERQGIPVRAVHLAEILAG